jgi:hypothetical protein
MNSVEWYREQSVVGSVIAHLKQNEWAIESVADTEAAPAVRTSAHKGRPDAHR